MKRFQDLVNVDTIISFDDGSFQVEGWDLDGNRAWILMTMRPEVTFRHHQPTTVVEEGVQEDFRSTGYCEDYPCCGHEAGDCFGQKYGSDESIKEAAVERMRMEQEGYFFDGED